MRTICKTLGIERTTPHDLRRTHGSTITALGFGRDAMNRIQNHRDGGIASVYDRHSCAEENKRIMEAVANHFVALVEGRGGDNVVRADFNVGDALYDFAIYLAEATRKIIRTNGTRDRANAVDAPD